MLSAFQFQIDSMKPLKFSLFILTIIPWVFMILLVIFYFHAGNILGHAPSYDNPDPGNLDIYSNYAPFIFSAALISAYAVPLWFILILVYVIIKQKNSNLKLIGMGMFTYLCLIFTFLSGIFEWFLD